MEKFKRPIATETRVYAVFYFYFSYTQTQGNRAQA